MRKIQRWANERKKVYYTNKMNRWRYIIIVTDTRASFSFNIASVTVFSSEFYFICVL